MLNPGAKVIDASPEWDASTQHYGRLPHQYRDGKLIFTALAIGRVPLINATKRLRFVLAQVVLTLAWASGRVLISNPVNMLVSI